jgi:hypothetical protein
MGSSRTGSKYEHFDEESVTIVMMDFFAGTVGTGKGN